MLGAPRLIQAFRVTEARENPAAWLAGASAITTLVSVAASQILLGAAILVLLWKRLPWRWPAAAIPLGAFTAWLLVSLAASPDPAAGLPVVKKLYVFLMLFVVFSAVRTLRDMEWIAQGWMLAGSLSAVWGFWQYFLIYLEAGPEYFYYFYNNTKRITGFLGHWMTFSGVTMLALLMTGSMILFAKSSNGSRWRKWIAAFALLSLALILVKQRGQWAGAAIGVTWLLWSRKRILVLLMPVVLGLAFLTNLMGVGDRVMELFQPKPGITDSLGHRAALRAVGKEMIEAHPVFGVGPGRVEGEFDEYVPQGVTFLKDWSKQHLHNIYYHYAAERGLPALALLLWFFGRILYDMARARFRDPEARWVIEGAIACTIAMMVSGWGEVNFSDSEVLGMWLAVVGCGYSASRLAQTS